MIQTVCSYVKWYRQYVPMLNDTDSMFECSMIPTVCSYDICGFHSDFTADLSLLGCHAVLAVRAPDVSKGHSTFKFRIKQSKCLMCTYQTTIWCHNNAKATLNYICFLFSYPGSQLVKQMQQIVQTKWQLHTHRAFYNPGKWHPAVLPQLNQKYFFTVNINVFASSPSSLHF